MQFQPPMHETHASRQHFASQTARQALVLTLRSSAYCILEHHPPHGTGCIMKTYVPCSQSLRIPSLNFLLGPLLLGFLGKPRAFCSLAWARYSSQNSGSLVLPAPHTRKQEAKSLGNTPSSVPSDPMPSSTRPSPLSSPLSKNGPHATHGPSTRPVLVRKRFPSTLSRRRLTSPHLTRPTVSSFLHSIFSVPSSLTRRPSTHLPSSRASSRMQWICTYPGPTTPLCAMYPA